jgi:hypothetical protein
MKTRFARTSDEVYLYVDRQPCPSCGHVGVGDLDSMTIGERDGERFQTYVYRCPQCDTRREFTFRVPEPPDAPEQSTDERIVFGDSRPSELLDAGEWLELAYVIVDGVPEDLDALGGEELIELRREVEVARAAIEEAMKFVPAGGTEVPLYSFWSERGRLMRLRHPGRFDRVRLDGNLIDTIRLRADVDAAIDRHARREG